LWDSSWPSAIAGATATQSIAAVEAKRPTETVLAKLEAAEPVSPVAAEDAGVIGATAARSAATADPVNYEVAADGTIEVQTIKLLGHCAKWLQIPMQRLRDVNPLTFEQAVIVGWPLKLDSSQVSVESFTRRRIAITVRCRRSFFPIPNQRHAHTVDANGRYALIAGFVRAQPAGVAAASIQPGSGFRQSHPGVTVIIPRLVAQATLADNRKLGWRSAI
jgi:hypothetical protein